MVWHTGKQEVIASSVSVSSRLSLGVIFWSRGQNRSGPVRSGQFRSLLTMLVRFIDSGELGFWDIVGVILTSALVHGDFGHNMREREEVETKEDGMLRRGEEDRRRSMGVDECFRTMDRGSDKCTVTVNNLHLHKALELLTTLPCTPPANNRLISFASSIMVSSSISSSRPPRLGTAQPSVRHRVASLQVLTTPSAKAVEMDEKEADKRSHAFCTPPQ
ncbi:unnamed protein product [Pleuronectes platessa]|uniref:Uncharacterized protein n=1 Tax=Pleuronectes platessa TaxID=8262 RepID=A0A9N7TW45_PLEPL|nr:unnamed protein product [Pleuronectes platessa]